MRSIRALAFALVACSNPSADDQPPTPGPIDPTFAVSLQPASGVTGMQVVNFGLPLPAGLVSDAAAIRIGAGGAALPASRVGLARYADGSLRSVQVQVEVDVGAVTALDVEVGASGGGDRAPVAVTDTLAADGTPRVWAIVPAEWLAGSGGFGPMTPRAVIAGSPLDAWGEVCDYARWDTDAFMAGASNREAWLFDRVTAMYRGYAFTGELEPLRSGYREAHLYRDGITGSGSATRIGVPGAADDLKYHYSQGLALHYLLTGDARFREAAENVAVRARDLWADPGYDGGADFWTERHAGFGLLALEHAAAVSDDRADQFAAWAATAVDAYLATQAQFPASWTDRDARCFAHDAEAHGESYGYVGCSPWMSAILADGLEAHALRVGGERARAVRAALVQLGRIIARDGRDGEGRPYYWMGLGRAGEVDDFEEHWGESAYAVAMAWHYSGRSDAALRAAADELVAGLRTRGEAGQVRSFNWQCRSAVMTPSYLR